MGPSILEYEIAYTIKILKNNKAPDPDGNMYVEVPKQINEENVDHLNKLLNRILM